MKSYEVLCDGAVLHDPRFFDQKKILSNASLIKSVNAADSFTFTIYPNNDQYGNIDRFTSKILIRRDGEAIFMGRVLNDKKGWNNQLTYSCESLFAAFNDSIVRPYEYTGTVRGYVEQLVAEHNSQVESDKQFTVRTVTITDPNDTIVRANSGYPTVMAEMQDKLVGLLGGYLVYEYDEENDINYLDYLADSTVSSTQKITLDSNLLSFSQERKGEDIITCLIPLGAKDGQDQRLTIKSVNSGLDYIEDATAVAAYGRIFGTLVWDDVTVPANLLAKAQAALPALTGGLKNIKLTAADLSQVDSFIDDFDLLNYITVEDDAHEISGRYLVTNLKISLDHPESNSIELGTIIQGLSAKTSKAITDITISADNVITAANVRSIAEDVSEKITGGQGGYVRLHINDQTGEPDELLIMDTDDITTATCIWRWNKNGLGYSSSGYAGPYTSAWAIADGGLNANFITNGTIQGIEIIANMGSIGGWEISSSGLYKEVTDPNNINKHYKVTIYTPDDTTPDTSPVLDFQTSTDAGTTWKQLFYVPGNGSLTLYSNYSRTDARINVISELDNWNRSFLNSRVLRLQNKDDPTIKSANLLAHELAFRDENETSRAIFWATGATFFDSDGNLTANYPASGWHETEVTDQRSASGKTTWKWLQNGFYTMLTCRREFANVEVNYQWGNIFCGLSTQQYPNGTDCNFKTLAYPFTFDSPPIVIATLDAPNGGNDGWLATNARWTQSNARAFLPAYDLARGSSATVPSIAVNYLVFGRIATQYVITNNLTNVTNSNNRSWVYEGNTYAATLTPTTGYVMDTVTITMGGIDVTGDVYEPSNGQINISAVTGAIVITASALEPPDPPDPPEDEPAGD